MRRIEMRSLHVPTGDLLGVLVLDREVLVEARLCGCRVLVHD
jgi:hypothetical protein